MRRILWSMLFVFASTSTSYGFGVESSSLEDREVWKEDILLRYEQEKFKEKDRLDFKILYYSGLHLGDYVTTRYALQGNGNIEGNPAVKKFGLEATQIVSLTGCILLDEYLDRNDYTKTKWTVRILVFGIKGYVMYNNMKRRK